jgi:phosphate transport system protein
MLTEVLNDLKKSILSYTLFVKDMILKSLKGLKEQDIKLLENVINDLEPYANAKEIEIDEFCISSIAQYEPKGKNLRQIIMALKINNDLERIADHAVNISETSIELFKSPFTKIDENIISMGEKVLNMLDEAISSYSFEDPDKAIKVCESDNIIDELNEKILHSFINKNFDSFEEKNNFLSSLTISRNLERIADLTTNIAEDVYYIVTGKILKHRATGNF